MDEHEGRHEQHLELRVLQILSSHYNLGKHAQRDLSSQGFKNHENGWKWWGVVYKEGFSSNKMKEVVTQSPLRKQGSICDSIFFANSGIFRVCW